MRLSLLLIVAIALVLPLVLPACAGLSEANKHYNAGLEFQEQGRLQEAIAEYDEAIRLNPEYTLAYANRARVYTMLYMDTEAEQDVNRALELGFDRELLDKEIELLKKSRPTPSLTPPMSTTEPGE